MLDYAEKHERRLPPAALHDKEGKPLLSWRVLILPHLGEDALYQQFRLDEPWDSPHNLALLGRMPMVYRPAFPDSSPSGTTRFQVFVGPGTPFESEKGPHLVNDFPDGLDQTLLLTEGLEAVPWTRPSDLRYSPDGPLPGLGPPLMRTSTPWGRGAVPICFADLFVRAHQVSTPRREQVLRWVIVRNDGKGWSDD